MTGSRIGLGSVLALALLGVAGSDVPAAGVEAGPQLTCVPPTFLSGGTCVLQSCFQRSNAAAIYAGRKRFLGEGDDTCSAAHNCRSSGFFSLAQSGGLVFAGTYNDGGGHPRHGRTNYLQVRSITDPTQRVEFSALDASANESFFGVVPVGATMVATSEAATAGAVWAWQPQVAGGRLTGGTWARIYAYRDEPDKPSWEVVRGLGVFGPRVYLSGSCQLTDVSSIRMFDRTAFERAAAGGTRVGASLGDIDDTGWLTIGFVAYHDALYAYGDGGLRRLSGASAFQPVCNTQVTGWRFKNAVVWKDAIWMAGQLRGRPAVFTYRPGVGCRAVFVASDGQAAPSRDNVKFWGLAATPNELFVSTLCFDEYATGACDAPLNARTSDRSGIFRCYDDPATPANECAAGKWGIFLTFPEWGIKGMLFAGQSLYVATNNAKTNDGGAVWRLHCP